MRALAPSIFVGEIEVSKIFEMKGSSDSDNFPNLDDDVPDLLAMTGKKKMLVRKDTNMCMVAPPDFSVTPGKR